MNTHPAIKIVFFDIDGTLYRKEGDILPQSVITAIRSLHSHNVIPAIATGRSIVALPQKIRQLIANENIDVIVSLNGQYNTYLGKVMSAHPINQADLCQIMAKLRRNNVPYASISESCIAVSADTAAVQCSLKPIGNYIVEPDYHLHHDVYQVLIFCREEDEVQLHKETIPQHYRIIRWHKECIDLLPNDSSKRRGIENVCQTLNIPTESVMVFGDAENDIEMVHAAGIGVAMGDACEELKAVANYITQTVEEDGILNALRHFKLAE